jgi:hypothetical protein
MMPDGHQQAKALVYLVEFVGTADQVDGSVVHHSTIAPLMTGMGLGCVKTRSRLAVLAHRAFSRSQGHQRRIGPLVTVPLIPPIADIASPTPCHSMALCTFGVLACRDRIDTASSGSS